jgi:sigma-E factor negative regulatory protein RseC
MPYKNGIVVNVEENGWVEVVTDKLDACADCVSARNCPSDCRSAKMVTRVRDEIGVQTGDTVSIYISRVSMLKSAAILYLVPIAFLLLGAGIGSIIAHRIGLGNSAAAILAGLAGLCLGYFLVKAFSMHLSLDSGFFPKIDRILFGSTDAGPVASARINIDGEDPIADWQETANIHPPPPQHIE